MSYINTPKPTVDFSILPADVKDKLAELELELSEGDITQKGYEKKRAKLLQPFENRPSKVSSTASVSSRQIPPYYNIADNNMLPKTEGIQISNEGYSYVTEIPPILSSHQKQTHSQITSDGSCSGSGDLSGHHQNKTRRTQRRITHNEKRYHSEVRQEAVQQALAALKNRTKPSLPMPSKRSSVLNCSPERNIDASDSSSEDEYLLQDGTSPDKEYNYPRDHVNSFVEPILKPPIRDSSVGGGMFNKKKNLERRPPQNLPPIDVKS